MPAQVLFFGSFRLDLANEQLWEGDVLRPLRPKVFAVLRYLAEHPGRLVTRDELTRATWPKTVVSESVLRGTIRELRECLGDDATAARFVETMPHRGYRFLVPVTTADRPAPVKARRSFVVGRDAERARLHAALERALRAERAVVFVTGEPGIGKTTVVDAFLADVERGASSPPLQVARGQCVEHYGPSEPYLPVLEAFGRLCRLPDGAHVVALLRRFAPTWLVQMPSVTSDEELASLQRRVQGATHERMLREMADALEALTDEQPLVLALEDLHWSDPSTLDLLGLLAQRRTPARLLVLGTYRPTDVMVSEHPLRTLKQELDVHRRCEELPLDFLTVAEVDQYLTGRFAGHALPAELGRVVHRGTEGNPLFMVNVLDDWVRQGVLVESERRWTLPATATVADLAAGVPESLRQLIEKQLARLTPEEQRVLETASVAGRAFTTGILAAALTEPLDGVETCCERLAARQQFLGARGTAIATDGTVTGRYGFLHTLHQQVLYERLAPARRVQLHRRIGECEEQAAGTRASEIAAELAMHFERGHDSERALRYLRQAGHNALGRSAHAEAIRLVERGIALLATLPETPERAHDELALQAMLGGTLAVTRGYAAPEVQRAYERAFELRRRIEPSTQDPAVLGGLWGFRFLRTELPTAQELAVELARLAEATPDPGLRLWAHTVQGLTSSTLGEIAAALRHLDAGVAGYDPTRHAPDRLRIGPQDAKTTCLAYAAWTLWRAGHPDQARRKAEEAIAFARELSHPFSLAFALDFAGAGVAMLARDVAAVAAYADELVALARDQSFPYWLAWGTVRQGWVSVQRERVEDGFARMREGLAAVRTTGAELSVSYILAQLAEAHAQLGSTPAGLALLDDALAAAAATGERWYEPELHRLKGELTLAGSRGGRARLEEAAAHFGTAIALARRQEARSFELRATIGLARLLRRQRKHTDARAALAAIYASFTEGFETADLRDARALLDALT